MKRTLLTLSLVVVGAAANANLDQITGPLTGTPDFGVTQIFGDFPEFSGTVIEDFNSDGIVTDVAMAFELSDASIFSTLNNRVKGWRVSYFANDTDAGNSGDNLDLNTIATELVTSGISYSTIVAGQQFRVDITGLNHNTGAGKVWIGMAAVMDFTGNGQIFILSQANGQGGVIPGNAIGVNPSNGFGLGKNFPVNSNAAYAVKSVPEPATMLALGAGLAAVAARRRRK